MLTNIDITPFKYLLRLYLQRDFRPLFVKPWYWNQRIVNQAAIFLVFPNTLFDRLGKIAYYRDYTELDDIDVLQEKIRIITQNEALDKIYPIWQTSKEEKQVHTKLRKKVKNISHDGKLLPIRDFSVNYTTMQKLFASYKKSEIIESDSLRYTKYGQSIFERRFLFKDQVDGIDADSMKTMFCSIIIGKKAKKEIMSDLESIGIDKAFIYPELEYTAEKIKAKYS